MKWINDGLIQESYVKVLKWYRKYNPAKYYCMDSSMTKNQYGIDCIGRNPTDRGRNATKISTLCDQNGVTISVHSSPANIPDVSLLEFTLTNKLETLKYLELITDKGYDSKYRIAHSDKNPRI